jgi:NADH:ubiquinone oxidoreductase subunit C
MPEDWEGYPARKDYPVQIKMTPKVYEPLQLTPQQFAENMQRDLDRAKQD